MNQYYLTIKNTGNVPDNYKIENSFKNYTSLLEYFNFGKSSVTVKPDQSVVVILIFDLPKNFTENNLTDIISIKVTSRLGGNTSELKMDIDITGHREPKSTEKPKQNIEDEESLDLMNIFLLMLGLVILILMLVILFVMFLRATINRQLRSNYPIKNKKVIHRERVILEPEHEKEEVTAVEVKPL
jgi:hypothetical protein